MNKKTFSTEKGAITYWTNNVSANRPTLVFLPGLTADHRLFDRQIACFRLDYNVLTWDAPNHGESRPFRQDFSLMDKAKYLHEILEKEGIRRPIFIGQSMGGYVSQCYMEKYPEEVAGFISIDSAPLQRNYMTKCEIFLLKHIEPLYRAYPWKRLKKDGATGCAETKYGQELMKSFIETYTKREYYAIAGHGFKILAQAIEANLPYEITCPTILICGEKDRAGSTKRYNRHWAKREGLPLYWIKNAGHNANTDQPEEVNEIIAAFLTKLHT